MSALASGSTRARRSVALVVGIKKYTNLAPLEAAKQDAVSIGNGLQAAGFDVIKALDCDRTEFLESLDQFAGKIAGTESDCLALFYYSGHGVAHQANHYLMPLDWNANPELHNIGRRLQEHAIDVDRQIVPRLSGCARAVVILDTCRTLYENLTPVTRDITWGPDLPQRCPWQLPNTPIIICYACGLGDVATDGRGHGLYTSYLLEELFNEKHENILDAIGAANTAVQAGNQRAHMDVVDPSHFKFKLKGWAGAGTAEEARGVPVPACTPSTAASLTELKRGAKEGDANAQFQVALCYYIPQLGARYNSRKAASFFEMASQNGITRAQALLANCYQDGDGVGKDDVKAVQRATDAARAGEPIAELVLGVARKSGRGGVEKDEAAAEVMFRSSKAGLKKLATSSTDPIDLNFLATLYLSGDGCQKDPVKAVGLMQKAAEQGYAAAQNNLGARYYNGEGVAKDLAKAVELFRKAAEQGYAAALFNLGGCYYKGEGVGKDLAQAAEWFRKAAEQGYAAAQHHLGMCYYQGEGVGKDRKQAVEWYRKAAEQGYAAAQYMLGDCYYKGEGVGKDLAQAAQWFRKAAEQGFAAAQNNLGVHYYNGEGVGKDLARAVEWFRKAAEQGYTAAQNWLGVCYYKGEGVGKDLAQAVEWFRKAAEQGYAAAQFNLGGCYYDGKGVGKDLAQAAEWFRKAAEQGYAPAQVSLWRIQKPTMLSKLISKVASLG